MQKYLICSLVALFTALSVFSQTKEDENSKSDAVAFSSRGSTLLKKEFIDMGKIKSVSFEVVTITDILKNDKVYCLKVTKTSSEYEFSGTLDVDEIDDCIKSFDYIKQNLLNAKVENYIECEYRTKDGMKIGAYCSNKKEWKPYIQIKSYTDRSIAVFFVTDLDNIISKLAECKNKISVL